jgi:hypothetical protein
MIISECAFGKNQMASCTAGKCSCLPEDTWKAADNRCIAKPGSPGAAKADDDCYVPSPNTEVTVAKSMLWILIINVTSYYLYKLSLDGQLYILIDY